MTNRFLDDLAPRAARRKRADAGVGTLPAGGTNHFLLPDLPDARHEPGGDRSGQGERT